jgi:O-antigen/teichoic acid export membrane protein
MQFAQVMLLARILTPADFGLMAMAGTAVAVASLFSDLGLSSALIHFPLPSKEVRAALYLLNIGLGLALAAILVALAYPIAAFYGHQTLVPLLALLALAFPLNAAGQQFRTLAEKELRFRELAKIEMASMLVAFVVAIGAAIAGKGVFALVAGVLTNAALNSIFASRLPGNEPLRFSSVDFRGSRSFLAYGGHRVGDQVWNALRQQLDVIIASASATPAAVALYAVPRNQSLRIANTIINPIITRVGLPLMARLQEDKTAIRKIYMKTMRLSASLNFPIYAFLALFPTDIIGVLLGAQWSGAARYLQIFALWGLIRSTGNPSGSLIYAVGMVRRAHIWNFLNLAIAAPILWAAEKKWGLPGLAWAMLFLQVAVFLAAWKFLINPACGAGLKEYTKQLVAPLVATTVAVAFSLMATARLSSPWVLPTGAAAFGGAYIASSLLINKPVVRTLRELASPIFEWKAAIQMMRRGNS